MRLVRLTASMLAVALLSACGGGNDADEAERLSNTTVPAAYDLVATINTQNAALRVSPVEAARIMGYSMFAAYAAYTLAEGEQDRDLAAATAGSEVAAALIKDPTKAANLRAIQARHGSVLDPETVEWAKAVAEKVLDRSKKTGYDESQQAWSSKQGTTSYDWVPTGRKEPGFEPGWGRQIPLIAATQKCVLPIPSDEAVRAEATKLYHDFNEADAVGTDVLWWLAGIGTPTPIGQWMRIASNAAKDAGLDGKEALLMLTRAAVAGNDAGIMGWREKYRHNLARPETMWVKLFGEGSVPRLPRETPNHPSYPSGHSVFGGAVVESVAATLGDPPARDSQLPDLYAPGERRSWSSMSVALAEAGMSRVHAGFHFPMDVSAGQELGGCVANEVRLRLDEAVREL